MHPIQDLFLESFSYAVQFDMHFYMHSYVNKKFILVKSGCYNGAPGPRVMDRVHSLSIRKQIKIL
jgi:hypothetical protein